MSSVQYDVLNPQDYFTIKEYNDLLEAEGVFDLPFPFTNYQSYLDNHMFKTALRNNPNDLIMLENCYNIGYCDMVALAMEKLWQENTDTNMLEIGQTIFKDNFYQENNLRDNPKHYIKKEWIEQYKIKPKCAFYRTRVDEFYTWNKREFDITINGAHYIFLISAGNAVRDIKISKYLGNFEGDLNETVYDQNRLNTLKANVDQSLQSLVLSDVDEFRAFKKRTKSNTIPTGNPRFVSSLEMKQMVSAAGITGLNMNFNIFNFAHGIWYRLPDGFDLSLPENQTIQVEFTLNAYPHNVPTDIFYLVENLIGLENNFFDFYGDSTYPVQLNLGIQGNSYLSYSNFENMFKWAGFTQLLYRWYTNRDFLSTNPTTTEKCDIFGPKARKKIYSLQGCFYHNYSLRNFNFEMISNFPVLTNCRIMFSACGQKYSQREIPISLEGMFSGCPKLNDISYIFNGTCCWSYDIPNLFKDCKNSLYSVGLAFCFSGWNTFHPELFADCPNLEYANHVFVSGNLNNCERMNSQYRLHINLQYPQVTNIDRNLFRGCSKLRSIATLFININTHLIPNWNLWQNWEPNKDGELAYPNEFRYFPNLVDIPQDLFRDCVRLENVEYAFAYTNIRRFTKQLLENCTNLTNVNGFFETKFNRLEHIDLDMFANKHKIVHMDNTFGGVPCQVEPNLSLHGKPLLTNCRAMFYSCLGVTEVRSDMFKDNPKLTAMEAMFERCYRLKKLTVVPGYRLFQALRTPTPIDRHYYLNSMFGATCKIDESELNLSAGEGIIPSNFFNMDVCDLTYPKFNGQYMFSGSGWLRIENYAFENFTFVDIPYFFHKNRLKYLGKGLFKNNKFMTRTIYHFSVDETIPAEKRLSTIEPYTADEDAMFYGCTNLENISGLFDNQQNLDWSIPSNFFKTNPNLKYGNHAFNSCYKIKGIGAGLFDNCKQWIDVNYMFNAVGIYWTDTTAQDFSSRIQQVSNYFVPDYLFANNPNLTTAQYCFMYSFAVKKIGKGLFKNCPKLTKVTNLFSSAREYNFSKPHEWNLSTIEPYTADEDAMFYGCTNLENISGLFDNQQNLDWSIPSNFFKTNPNLKYGNHAFNSCYKIKGIGAGLFDNCKQWIDVNYMFLGVGQKHLVITEFEGNIVADNSEVLDFSIPDYLFANCPNLVTIYHPFAYGAYQKIGKGIFRNCTNLVNVFNGFTGNNDARLHQHLVMEPYTADEDAMFYGCTKLENISSLFSYQTQFRWTVPRNFLLTNTKLKNIQSVFEYCYNLYNYDVNMLKHIPTLTNLINFFYLAGRNYPATFKVSRELYSHTSFASQSPGFIFGRDA